MAKSCRFQKALNERLQSLETCISELHEQELRRYCGEQVQFQDCLRNLSLDNGLAIGINTSTITSCSSEVYSSATRSATCSQSLGVQLLTMPKSCDLKTASQNSSEMQPLYKVPRFHELGMPLPEDATDGTEIAHVAEAYEEDYIYSELALKHWADIVLKNQMLQVMEVGDVDGDAVLPMLPELSTAISFRTADTDQRRLHRCTVRPVSWKRISWDFLGFFFISYDMITFPFIEAFGIEPEIWLEVMDLITLSYWMVDLVSRFFVGYYEDGVLEMRLPNTARKYLRTSFIFDFLVVGMDLPLTILGKHEQLSSTLRLGRLSKSTRLFAALRVLRGIKLVRILRFDQFFSQVSSTTRSEMTSIILRFANLVLLIVLANHLFACVWYGIGSGEWDAAHNWVDHYKVDEKDTTSKYLLSLHWSLTQFTPASMPVFPQNKYETFYAICILLCGMLGLSSCVSSITGLVMQLKNRHSCEVEKQAQLRVFLNQNKISMNLTQQIWNFLKTNKERHVVRLSDRKVDLLQEIPDSIKLRLRSEMYIPTLVQHPFFLAMTHWDLHAINHICMKAISQDTLLPGHEYFAKGRVSKGMTFVCVGSLIYSLIKRPGLRKPKTRKYLMFRASSPIANSRSGFDIVEEGGWVAEATLWMPKWMHCGWLESLSVCEMLLIDVDEFHAHFRASIPPDSHTEVKRYSAYFQAMICDNRCWHQSDIRPDKDEVMSLVDKAFIRHQSRTSFPSKVGKRGNNILWHMLGGGSQIDRPSAAGLRLDSPRSPSNHTSK